MTQADRVHSTPPINTSALDRRRILTGGAALAAAVAIPQMPAQAAPVDPIFAAIERHKALTVPFDAAWTDRARFDDTGELTQEEKQHLRKLNDTIDATHLALEVAACDLMDTVPTTPAGIVAALRVVQTHYRGDDNGHMPSGEWLYEDEEDPRNGRDWLECFLDTIASAVEALEPRGLA